VSSTKEKARIATARNQQQARSTAHTPATPLKLLHADKSLTVNVLRRDLVLLTVSSDSLLGRMADGNDAKEAVLACGSTDDGSDEDEREGE